MSAFDNLLPRRCSIRNAGARGRHRRQDPQLCAHARAAEDPTTPAPTTEWVASACAWRARSCSSRACSAPSKWTWIFGGPFTPALLLVLAAPSALLPATGVARSPLIQPFGTLRPASRWWPGLAGLWARRWFVDRGALHLDAVRPPEWLALLPGHRLSGWAFALRRTHRHRGAEGLRARAHALRLASAAHRSGVADASDGWSRC